MTGANITVPRSRRRARLVWAALAVCSLAALVWAAFVQPEVRIVYNSSNSIPVGWYRIEAAHSLHVGSIVLTTLPADAAALAAQRGYLPSHIPLLKRVGAIAPQHVCIVNGIVRIDGVPVAAVLRADRWNRPLPSWPQCRQLAQGELFLLSAANPASFDSRYFGPIRIDAVIGVARPIRVKPQAWLALAGGRAAPCAAPPGHRTPVPSGRGKMQGKIKGRGTWARERPVCTWAWRGTRRAAARCRARRQHRTGIDQFACLARADALVFAGAPR